MVRFVLSAEHTRGIERAAGVPGALARCPRAVPGGDFPRAVLIRTGYMPAAGVKIVYANSRYGVIVNTTQQRAYFYEYGKLIDVVPCTTGSRDLYTRYGMFLISDRKPFFPGDTSDSTVYYCTQITGRVFFHSVMYSMATGDIDPKSLSQIGVVPASSGCIRLPIDKAKQVYETFPPGTVIIVKK